MSETEQIIKKLISSGILRLTENELKTYIAEELGFSPNFSKFYMVNMFVSSFLIKEGKILALNFPLIIQKFPGLEETIKEKYTEKKGVKK